MNYTNPRTFAEFNDWPSGQQRVRCVTAADDMLEGSHLRWRDAKVEDLEEVFKGRYLLLNG